MTRIDRKIFSGLFSIEYLTLENNEIYFIADFSFEDSKKLSNLTINENKLVEINNNTFYGLISLKLLYISNNLIQIIDMDS